MLYFMNKRCDPQSSFYILILQHMRKKYKFHLRFHVDFKWCVLFLRIDYCDEQSEYYDGDISGSNDDTFFIDMSIESPDFSLSNDIT